MKGHIFLIIPVFSYDLVNENVTLFGQPLTSLLYTVLYRDLQITLLAPISIGLECLHRTL